MSREANRLSDLDVRQAKAAPIGKSLILPDGWGLRVVVTDAGKKHFEFKTAVGGKERTVRLGLYPSMTLAAARREAERLRLMTREGRNPVQVKQVERIRNRVQAETTFEAVAEELLTGKKKNCSAAYYKKISCGIRANLFPMLGTLPVQTIDAPILREALKKIEARGALEMLGNVRRWAGEVFDFAKAHGQYAGDNPAHALTRNVFKKHQGTNMVALEWPEVPGFWKNLSSPVGDVEPATLCAVKIMFLCALRPGEVRGAKWSEFDFDHARWEIPAERMKARKMHAVPLSKQVLAVLAEAKQYSGNSEYLFPARRGSKSGTLSDRALLNAVRRAAGRDVDAHGCRATFSTYVAESGLWPDNVKDAALAHMKGGIEGRYDRATHYPERIRLMQWYADQVDATVKGAEVIALPTRAA